MCQKDKCDTCKKEDCLCKDFEDKDLCMCVDLKTGLCKIDRKE